MNEEYKKALMDGRWQIRKTEIMLRDGFTCKECGAKASDGAVLNVHHLNYYPDRNPWEYEDRDLVTLCEDCHKKAHPQKQGAEDYWSYEELLNLREKLVLLGHEGDSRLYLFGRNVAHGSDQDPASIEIEIFASNVSSNIGNLDFSVMIGDATKYNAPAMSLMIHHSDQVTILEGDTEINILWDMIHNAQSNAHQLTEQRDMKEYKYIIYTLFSHLLHIQYRNVRNLNLEMMFMRRYVRGWNAVIIGNDEKLSARDIVKAYLRENKLSFSIPETQWAFDIIEDHKDEADFDFMQYVSNGKEINLTDIQKVYVEVLKDEKKHILEHAFALKEPTSRKRVKEIKHLLLDLHLDFVESRLKEITEGLKGQTAPESIKPLLSEFSELQIERNRIWHIIGKDIQI